MTEVFVLLYKTRYGSEGYPVGIFASLETAKTAILDHEKKRSASYNESGVLYEICLCKMGELFYKIIYSEAHKVSYDGVLSITVKDYDTQNVHYVSHRI